MPEQKEYLFALFPFSSSFRAKSVYLQQLTPVVLFFHTSSFTLSSFYPKVVVVIVSLYLAIVVKVVVVIGDGGGSGRERCQSHSQTKLTPSGCSSG